jgi:hypothetical protein
MRATNPGRPKSRPQAPRAYLCGQKEFDEMAEALNRIAKKRHRLERLRVHERLAV